MKYYGINMEGYFKLHSDTSLPLWTSENEANVIYNSNLEEMFLGTSSNWFQMISEKGGVLSGQLSTSETNYGNYFKNITISGSDASGGTDGDVWLKYV